MSMVDGAALVSYPLTGTFATTRRCFVSNWLVLKGLHAPRTHHMQIRAGVCECGCAHRWSICRQEVSAGSDSVSTSYGSAASTTLVTTDAQDRLIPSPAIPSELCTPPQLVGRSVGRLLRGIKDPPGHMERHGCCLSVRHRRSAASPRAVAATIDTLRPYHGCQR
jgi:hypothetical protein